MDIPESDAIRQEIIGTNPENTQKMKDLLLIEKYLKQEPSSYTSSMHWTILQSEYHDLVEKAREEIYTDEEYESYMKEQEEKAEAVEEARERAERRHKELIKHYKDLQHAIESANE